MSNLAAVACRQYRAGAWADIQDVLAPEVELTLLVEGQGQRALLAHPHDLDPLVLGHVRMEMANADQIPVLLSREGLTFRLALEKRPESPGGESAAAIPFPRALEADEVLAAMETLFGGKGLWAETGCFHRAGLYDPVTRSFAVMVEDIGRHNCMDRLAGWLLTTSVDPGGLALFVSARITASMCAKALGLGVRLAVSRSAVTTKALERARNGGLTLLGFCREGRFTVFHDPEQRIGV